VHRPRSRMIRNKLDLSNRAQVRLVKKRLRLSETELSNIVARIGNSISAISKEVTLQRAIRIVERTPVPQAVTIASVVVAETDASKGPGPTDPPV
jgi:hypothetical protein